MFGNKENFLHERGINTIIKKLSTRLDNNFEIFRKKMIDDFKNILASTAIDKDIDINNNKPNLYWILTEKMDQNNEKYVEIKFNKEIYQVPDSRMMNILNDYNKTYERISYKDMFKDCVEIKTLILPSDFDTSNVFDMSGMFKGCVGLEHINLSMFNTSSVTNLSSMFENCTSLETVDISSFDLENVLFIDNIFSNCSKLHHVNFMRYESVKCLDMLNYIPERTSAYYRDGKIEGSLKKITEHWKVTEFFFDHRKCINLEFLDKNAKYLNEAHFLDIKDVSEYYRMISFKKTFSNCKNLIKIEFPDSFNTINVVDMSYMFENCYSMLEIDIKSLNISNVTSFEGCFYDCRKLNNVILDNLSTNSLKSTKKMFSGCESLHMITFPKLFNTSIVEDMSHMFYDCQSVAEIDLSMFATKNVRYMEYMFSRCSNLTKIVFSQGFENIFNTENVISTSNMFSFCTNLAINNFLEFSSLKSVSDASKMFAGCSSLICDDLSFIMPNASDVSGMFDGCETIESVNILAEKIVNAEHMFSGCSSLKSVNFSQCNMSSVTNMTNMFLYCSNLEYVTFPDNFDIDHVQDKGEIFLGCTNIKSHNIPEQKVEDEHSGFDYIGFSEII